jgi:hypothetical protein
MRVAMDYPPGHKTRGSKGSSRASYSTYSLERFAFFVWHRVSVQDGTHNTIWFFQRYTGISAIRKSIDLHLKRDVGGTERSNPMQPIIFAFVGMAGVFLLAGATRNQGWYLSDQLCQQGAILCDNPGLILISVCAIALIVTIRAVVKT